MLFRGGGALLNKKRYPIFEEKGQNYLISNRDPQNMMLKDRNSSFSADIVRQSIFLIKEIRVVYLSGSVALNFERIELISLKIIKKIENSGYFGKIQSFQNFHFFS